MPQPGQRAKGPLLMTARWLIAHDRDSARHQILEHGELVIDADRITFTGFDYPGEVAERMDFGEAVIGPGFIDLDALADLDTTILGFDNQPAWKKGRIWPRSYIERGPYEMYTPDQLAFQKRFAFAQLIKNGITTALPIASLFYREWGETVTEFEAALEAAEKQSFPSWIEMDVKSMKGIFKSNPDRTDLPATINESLVVELYSK